MGFYAEGSPGWAAYRVSGFGVFFFLFFFFLHGQIGLFGFGTVENGFKKFFCPYNNRPFEPILTAMSETGAITLTELLEYQKKHAKSERYPTVKGGQKFSADWLRDSCQNAGVDFKGSNKKDMLENLISYYQTTAAKARPFNKTDCLQAAGHPQPKSSPYSNENLQDLSQQVGSPRGTKKEMCDSIHQKITANNSTVDVLPATVDQLIRKINQGVADQKVAQFELADEQKKHLADMREIQAEVNRTNGALMKLVQKLVQPTPA